MKNKKFNILLIIILITLPVILVTRVLQNDVFYSIKVGESIIKNGLEKIDHFSFISNLSYTYPHFLFDIFIYYVYKISGFFGIYIITIFLSFLLFLSLFYVLSLKANKNIALLITVLTSFCMKPYLTSRAQLISYIILLFIHFFIIKVRDEKKGKYYLFTFLLGVLLANTHPAIFPVALLIFIPYLFNDLLYIFKVNTFKFLVEKEKIKRTLYLFLTTIISGFMTFNSNSYTYIIKTKMDVSMSYISEHLPPTIENSPFLYLFIFLIFLLFICTKKKIKVASFTFIVGFIILSLISSRSFALLLVLTPLCYIEYLTDLKLDLLKNTTLYLCIIAFFISGAFVMYKYESKKSFVNEKIYPTEAVKFVKNEMDTKNIRLYNEYNFGSYLILNDIKVFIDSRADLYTKGFNRGCTVFYDAMNIYKNYIEVFNKYDITHALIYKDSLLSNLLNLDSNFKELYIDEYFKIYEYLR